jgi:hypothetical protein
MQSQAAPLLVKRVRRHVDVTAVRRIWSWPRTATAQSCATLIVTVTNAQAQLIA